MKNFIYLVSIATTLSTLFIPGAIRAQGYPYGGYSSTTIYVPSTETTTTTTTTIQSAQTNINPNYNSVPKPTNIPYYNPFPNSINSPFYNSFPNSINSPFYGSGFPDRNYRQYPYRQPTIIFTQPNSYPGAIQSTCSTSIIGSPIPSAVPLDRSGQPCR
jgi:hypothetical protein